MENARHWKQKSAKVDIPVMLMQAVLREAFTSGEAEMRIGGDEEVVLSVGNP